MFASLRNKILSLAGDILIIPVFVVSPDKLSDNPCFTCQIPTVYCRTTNSPFPLPLQKKAYLV